MKKEKASPQKIYIYIYIYIYIKRNKSNCPIVYNSSVGSSSPSELEEAPPLFS